MKRRQLLQAAAAALLARIPVIKPITPTALVGGIEPPLWDSIIHYSTGFHIFAEPLEWKMADDGTLISPPEPSWDPPSWEESWANSPGMLAREQLDMRDFARAELLGPEMARELKDQEGR